ncbi:MAG: LacI family DNA-binding transcriptional regulator [Acutalibacteraceae bacterium]|nr:LacI family DNA-binding transcriptional regulator [Acutalibacteraceae bacterium]
MTLKDVALKANCSVSTVSKALKNSSEISLEAKKRILEVAKECGYLKKATTRSAVLGGFKTVIFNDVKGDSGAFYIELQKLAKKQGLTLLYISISEKESVELLSELGAFGLIIKGGSEKLKDAKIFYLKEIPLETTEFLKEISSFMPKRPSRAMADKPKTPSPKKDVLIVKEEIKENKDIEQTNNKTSVPQKKDEIWLL